MDTVALLAWTAASLEDGDKHSLATSVSIYFVICIWYLKMDSIATSESFLFLRQTCPDSRFCTEMCTFSRLWLQRKF